MSGKFKKPARLNKKIQLSNIDKLLKSKKKLANSKDKTVTHKTLKNLYELISNVTQSYAKIKSGNVIALTTSALNLLAESSKGDMLNSISETTT